MKNTKNRTRILSILAIVFCLVMALGITAFAAENDVEPAANTNVAKVGNTEYATIDEAIANWTNGTTLTLLSDVTLSDVIKLNSDEYHILDLGAYTMTAAKNKDAIQYVIKGRSSASYALDIKADAENPGGINAPGKSIVTHTKPLISAPSKDRPITRFYGGVFNASYVVKQGGTFGAGYTGASAPYFQFYGGEYNGTIYTNRSQNQFYGGTFNGSMQMSVDSSAYTQIAGGTFKNLSNSMGSALNSDKFVIGTSKGSNNGSVCIDENGYYVISTSTPAEAEASVASNYDSNNYFYYSTVNTNGMYYEDVYDALEANKTGIVTVFTEELDLSNTTFAGTIVVPEGEKITIVVDEDVTPAWTVKSTVENVEPNVTYEDANGNELVKGDDGNFESPDPALGKVAQIGDQYYETLSAALEAANAGNTITFVADITEDVTVNKAVTIDGANFTYTGSMELKADTTIKNVNFDGKGYNGYAVNTRGAQYVTIENCTAKNYGYGFVQLASATALTTVKNVTASNMNYGVKVDYSGAVVLDNADITAGVAAVLNSNYGEKTITIKNSKLNILGTWTRNNTIKTNYVFEGANTIDSFIIDAAIDNFKLAANATLTAPEGVSVTTDVENYKVAYNNGVYSLVEAGLNGSGTETDPYQIGSVEDLIMFRDSVNAGEDKYNALGMYFVLTDDIDLAGINWVGIGSINAAHGFMGNFNGNGFKIKNLTITNPALDSDGYAYAGLFSVTEGTDKNNQNVIKNLTIENVTISTNGHIVAAAIAYPYYTIVEDVTVCGNIAITGGDYTAGVLAYTRRCVNASNLTLSANAGSYITGNQTVGGVISDIQMNGGLTAVYSNFSASGVTVTGTKSVGGIAGIIATQTLNGATVKNVKLVCSDARVGIVAGSLGGTSTVSNVIVENVSGATAIIGATYNGAVVEAVVGNTYYDTFAKAYAAAKADETITLLADLTMSEILVIDKAITLDGNYNTLTSTAARAINVLGADGVTIKNLTINCSGERAINVIQNATNVTIDNVTATADNYTVNVASSAPNAVVAIKNSTLNGLCTVNVTSAGAKVTVDNSTINCNDNNTTAGESYAALSLGKEAVGGSIVATNTTVNVTAGSDSYKGRNGAENGTVTINGSTEDVLVIVAVITYEGSNYYYSFATLAAAIEFAKEGDVVTLIRDVDYGTTQLKLEKAITLDLGGYTLTTRNAWGGMSIKNNASVKNGTIVHASNTAAIKVWNATAFENLVIDVQGKGDANKTIGGIVLQSGSTTRVGSIKNVTIKGAALTNGIETYNCGDATKNVIGSMENVTIDAVGTGMLISAPCGTATNCTISGGTNGIEIWIKGNYSATLSLVDSKVEGGVYAHDEFNNNAGVVNNGTLSLTTSGTTNVDADDITLVLARAENVGGLVKEVKDNAEAKVNDVYYATLAEAIKAAKAGDVVTVFAGTYAMPSMKAGITIVGEGKVTFEGTLSGTLENLTLKNIYIKGGNAQRWAYAKGDLVFENVTFHATGVYALHFDGITAGANLTYTNCTIIGWAAMSGSPESVVFDGCTFKGNGTYGVIRTYFDATLTNCTFNVANVNTNDIYEDGIHAVSGAVVTVDNCTNVNGEMMAIINHDSTSFIKLDGKLVHILAGSGTETDPYMIKNLAQLNYFRDSVNAGDTKYNAPGVYVALGNDIDLAGATWKYINTFYGKFDGNGHTISNFKIDATAGHAAFFYKLASKDSVTPASVENLILSNVTATVGKNCRVAALVVSYNKTDIKNVTVKDFTVTTTGATSWIAGLACSGTVNSEVTISDCTVKNFAVTDEYGAQFISGITAVIQRNGSEADGTNVLSNLVVNNFKVTVNGIVANGASTAVGGLIGQTQSVWQNPHFKNCSVTGLDVVATGRVDVGGFMAHPGSYTYATDCTVEGKIDVTGVTSSTNYAGGFFGDYGWGDNVGKGNHKITNCTVNVDITTKVATAGGFVGSGINTENRNKNITLTNCEAKGTVVCVEGGTATIGGFAGNTDRGIYDGCSAPAGIPFIGEILTNSTSTNPVVTYVASVGNTYYASFADAWAAAKDGDTITLYADIEMSEGITNTKKITLDLNGYTITGTDTATGSFGLITNKGELTITGNGTMTLVAPNNNRGWNAYSSVISNTVGGKLIVENGTIEHLGGTDMAYAIDNLTNGKGTYAETVINGGTIKSTYRAIRMFLNGTEAQNILTVNGGVIEGANKSIWMQDPSKNANTGAITVGAGAVLNGDVYLSVTAGSTAWPVQVSIAASAVNGNVLTNDNVPECYVLENVNGTYEVNKYAVVIGGQYYFESLEDAVANAKNKNVLKLLCDSEGSGIVINKNITIDFNGYTYTFSDNAVGSIGTKTLGFQILKGNTVELKNGILQVADSAADKYAMLIQNYADLKIRNMILDGTNLDRSNTVSYVVSINSGRVYFIGNVEITSNDRNYAGDVAIDVYDYSAAGYDLPMVDIPDTVKIDEFATIADAAKAGKVLAAARASKVFYANIQQAIDNSASFSLVQDYVGPGFVIDKQVNINLGGFTLTINSGVGSANTKTNGIQILKGAKVGLSNGTIAAADNGKLAILIQNYGDLQITNVKLDGTNLDYSSTVSYTLSINSGNVKLMGTTNVIANDRNLPGDIAIDVYDYSAAGYEPPVVSIYSTATYTEGKLLAAAKYGNYHYSSLQQCIDKHGTATLVCDFAGPGVVFTKNATINFNGFTYTFTSGVGSTGTESNGFQILEGNRVTLNNGTLKVADSAANKFYILVQNYGNLTLNSMTLDGTNLDKWSETDGDSYTLSNNSGNININGTSKIIANNNGDKAFAFDVCDKTAWGYELPKVKVAATATIDGKIEAAAKIGVNYYATLDQAIADRDNASSKDKIVLKGDIVLKDTLTIAASKAIVLDLNGYTITQTKACTGHYAMIVNKAILTIEDSVGGGKISFTDNGAGDPNFGWGSYTIVNENKLYVNGGTIENLSAQNANGSVKHMYCAIQQNNTKAQLQINGGTISTPSYRSIRINAGSLTFGAWATTEEGATIEGQVWIQPFADGIKVNVNNGKFSPRGVDGSSIYVDNGSKTVAFRVNGGEFATKIGCANADALKGAIRAGKFTDAAYENTNEVLFNKTFVR